MNFIIDLSLSKRNKVVYNLIFVIIDKYTKIIKYLSINIKIDILKLTNMFFKKIVYSSIYQQILLIIKILYSLMLFN